MNVLFSRWLPAIARNSVVRNGSLTFAGLAFASGVVAGPATAAQAAAPASTSMVPVASVPVDQSVAAISAGDDRVDGDQRDVRDKDRRDDQGRDKDRRDDRDRDRRDHGRHADRHASRIVDVQYEAQPNFFYCGPASTRIALSAQGHLLSQDELAKKLGTTEAGTNSAEDTTRVLNEITGGDTYRTTELRDAVVTSKQIDRLAADVMRAVDDERPVVANVKGTASDVDGRIHSYEGGHYLTVVGYRDGGESVLINDPADPAQPAYWMSTITLANWMAERGYSS